MRAPTTCAHSGCPRDATKLGKCDQHQRKAWANRSPSSFALANSTDHKRARIRAARRAKGRCEHCGHKPTPDGPPLALHHFDPVSQGGKLVQAASRLHCAACHLRADRKAGSRRG
jgi:5-methylcytosine-specific restriction protein A